MNPSYRAENRIAHFVAKDPTTLVECLKTHFKLQESEAHNLIELGSIYQNKRRVFQNIKMGKGAYIRVHLKPKRFAVDLIQWKDQVVANEKDFIVIQKPSGIPIHATLDNHEENALTQMRKALGFNLYVTQRLDVPVSGLTIFAKTKEFQAHFNKLLSERRVEKKYTALTETTVTLGHHLHYMEPSERAPKKMSLEKKEGWLACELIVESSAPISKNEKTFYLSNIQLLTGRTHQIRAQLALLNAPLYKDSLYGTKKGQLEETSIGLQCTEIAFENYRCKRQADFTALLD